MSRDNRTIYGALGRHPVHPFPARMAPEIVYDLIAGSPRPIRILDPMMGSGTVVALARSQNHQAFGVDIDPLATLISRVWVTTADQPSVREAAIALHRRAALMAKSIEASDAYPTGASEDTRKFIRYWFDLGARRQLTALSRLIADVEDDSTQDILWCAFSRLIIAKDAGASLARDLAHSRPHKSFKTAPSKPLPNFLGAVEHVLKNCLQKGKHGQGPKATIKKGDARRLPIEGMSIDLVLTSPPYLNAIDYIRCSKFSLVWMGHNVDDLTTLRSKSVGTEVGRALPDDEQVRSILAALNVDGLSRRHAAMLSAYIDDMRLAIKEVHRVLVPGGRALYVIGENTVRGVYIQNARIIAALAESVGLRLDSEQSRPLPQNRRYMPPPKSDNRLAFDGRMRSEVVLSFSKGL